MEKTKQETISFYHGNVDENFSIDSINVTKKTRLSPGTSIIGFYMYGEEDRSAIIRQTLQSNYLNNSNNGIAKITMPKELKILKSTPFSICSITREQIVQLQKEYDLIVASGKSEFILLNKDKILNLEVLPIDIKEAIKEEKKHELVLTSKNKN